MSLQEKRVSNLNKMGAELYTLTEDFHQCQEDIWKYQCTKYSKVEDEKSTEAKVPANWMASQDRA